MELDHLAGVGVDRTVGQLRQLTSEGSGIGGGDLAIRQLQNQLLLQVRIPLGLRLGEMHLILGGDQIRHFQVVGGLHGDRDVRDLPVDRVLRKGQRFVGVDDLAVALVRHEVGVAVLGNEASETLSHIQQPELRPQVHEAVGTGCAGQADDPLDRGPDTKQGLEALGLVILEGRELVHDHGVVVEGKAAVLDQPAQVLPVDDRDVRTSHQGGAAFLGGADSYGIGQMLQMGPLADFGGPRIAGHTQRRNHQHAMGYEAVKQQIRDGSQGDHRLAQTHIEQDSSHGVGFNVVDGVGLIIMRCELHPASLRSAPRCR